jgi:ribosomal protein S1
MTKRGLSGFLLLTAASCCLPKEEVEGYIRTSELSRDPVDDPKKAIREEQEIEAMFMAVDRKKRIITLSIIKLGDLLKPQLDVSETGKEHD